MDECQPPPTDAAERVQGVHHELTIDEAVATGIVAGTRLGTNHRL